MFYGKRHPILLRAWRIPRLALHVLLAMALAGYCSWRPGARNALLVWWCRRALRILGIRVRMRGEASATARVCVANHLSYLDILCLAAHAPGRFLAKVEVSSWPLFGWLAKTTGTLFIDRQRPQDSLALIAEMQRVLDGGERLLFFPEGTTGRAAEPMLFHPVLFEAATRLRCSVQPIALRYPHGEGNMPHPAVPFVDDQDLLSHLWIVLGEAGIQAELIFTDPLPPASRRLLASESRRQICLSLQDPPLQKARRAPRRAWRAIF